MHQPITLQLTYTNATDEKQRTKRIESNRIKRNPCRTQLQPLKEQIWRREHELCTENQFSRQILEYRCQCKLTFWFPTKAYANRSLFRNKKNKIARAKKKIWLHYSLSIVSVGRSFTWMFQLNRAPVKQSIDWTEFKLERNLKCMEFQYFNSTKFLLWFANQNEKTLNWRISNISSNWLCFNWIWIYFTVRNRELMCNILNFFANNESQLQMCRKMCEEAVCGMGASNTLADIYHPSHFKCYSTEFRAFRNTNVFKHL